MAVTELKKSKNKTNEIEKSSVTEKQTAFVDKSNLLFDQMQMIAFNNKMFLKLN